MKKKNKIKPFDTSHQETKLSIVQFNVVGITILSFIVADTMY